MSVANRSLRVLVLGASLGLLGGVLPAGPAGASGTPTFYNATNSGFQVFSSTESTGSISANFTVPTVSGCTAAKRGVAFGVLIENINATVSDAPNVAVGCHHGASFYTAFLVVNGSATALSAVITPGDAITVSASMTTATASETFTDNTTGYTQSDSGAGGTPAYQFAGSEPFFNNKNGTVEEVATFSAVSLADVVVNGASIGSYTAATGLGKYVRTTNGDAPPSGTVQIKPGKLGPASFKLTFEHS
jgi:hypothetical protein